MRSQTNIRVALVDDHPIVLDGLARLLGCEADMEIVARCSDGTQAIQAAREVSPDVVLLDLVMKGVDGIEVLGQLRAEGLPCRIVVLTAAINDQQVLKAMKLGAEGIVLKEMAPSFIIRAIRKVHAGGKWIEMHSIGPMVTRLLQDGPANQELARSLSAREQAVVRLLVSGLHNSEIAARLFISEGTVKTHLHKIYEKLGVRSRLELAAYARARGFA